MGWLRKSSHSKATKHQHASDRADVPSPAQQPLAAKTSTASSHDSRPSAAASEAAFASRPKQPLEQLRASAAQLWATAADERGVSAAEPAPTSATEPLTGHPYYSPVCVLNKGASGLVQLSTDNRTGHRYAIKFIERGAFFDVRTISRELMNQRMCYGHPNIIQLKEVFLTSHHLGIAMEYADGGDLSQYIDDQSQKGIDGLPEDDVRWLFQQLIVALDYCHRLGIANRDVKLDNMMLHGTWPSPVLKICDFGFSKDEAGQSVSKSTCGTPEYMAPEVLFERSYNGKAADVWSCGVSLYVMLTGFFPFARDSDEDCTNVVRMQRMFTRIIQGKYTPLDQVSPACQDLMHRLLQPDPQKRATVDSIIAHPWFQTNLPPPLMTLNKRIMATSAHNAGIAGVTQSATEVLSLVEGGRSRRQLRSASASPADYQQQLAEMHAQEEIQGQLAARCNSQPLHYMPPLHWAQPLPSIASPHGSASEQQPATPPQHHGCPPPGPRLQGFDDGAPRGDEQTQWHSLSHGGPLQIDTDGCEDMEAIGGDGGGIPHVPSGRFSRMSL